MPKQSLKRPLLVELRTHRRGANASVEWRDHSIVSAAETLRVDERLISVMPGGLRGMHARDSPARESQEILIFA
jgi:hypothetical protein